MTVGVGMRLRPMGVGDVLDETFRLYRRHFREFVIATAVVTVPSGLAFVLPMLGLGLSTSGGGSGSPGAERVIAFIALLFPLALLAGLAYLLQTAALVRLASDAVLGLPLSIGAAYRSGLGRILPLLWCFLLFYLVFGLLSITVIGLPVAIFLAIGWSVAVPVVVLERGNGAGLRRSSGLVGGHRWRTLAIMLVMSLIVGVLSSLPSGMIGLVLGLAVAVGDLGPAATVAIEAASQAVGVIVGSLVGALIWIAITVLYYELRTRKEAFDLEQRLAMEPPA